MSRRKPLPPAPEAVKVPATREGPEWERFCADHPLHKAVAGPKGSAVICEARAEVVLDLLSQAKSSNSIIRFGAEQWGLGSRNMEKVIAQATAAFKQRLADDRPDYIAQMVARVEGMIEEAAADRQYSAAAGLLSILGRWLYLDPSTHGGVKR